MPVILGAGGMSATFSDISSADLASSTCIYRSTQSDPRLSHHLRITGVYHDLESTNEAA
jgi:hypothetical protein